MKRILLSGVMVLLCFGLSAQLKIGAHVGVPSGNYSDFYSIGFGGDLFYMLGEPSSMISYGVSAGYTQFMNKDFTLENGSQLQPANYVPIAAVGRATLFDLVTLGPDLGYAIGLNNNESGFYWRGVLGLVFGQTEIHAYYKGLPTPNKNLNSVGLGFVFSFSDK